MSVEQRIVEVDGELIGIAVVTGKTKKYSGIRRKKVDKPSDTGRKQDDRKEDEKRRNDDR